ncbi:hypothetical protein [Sphingomonas zeae]|jgi:hypothetical protein
MKGCFPDATPPKEKAQEKQVRDWLMACCKTDLAEFRSELQALGIPDPKLNNTTIRNPLCAQVASAPNARHWAGFAAFQRSVDRGAPIADA